MMNMNHSATASDGAMGGMPTGMAMSNSGMPMTFIASVGTPLFWDWWRPTGPGQYAATCVFIVFLATVTRILFSVRPGFHDESSRRSNDGPEDPSESQDGEQLLPAHVKSDMEDVPLSASAPRKIVRRWWAGASLGLRLKRAAWEVVLVCLGYFLMLAVMTMNTGYFISVLVGVFLGMVLIGDAANDDDSKRRLHHC